MGKFFSLYITQTCRELKIDYSIALLAWTLHSLLAFLTLLDYDQSTYNKKIKANRLIGVEGRWIPA